MPNGVHRCRDDRHVAVTATDDAMFVRLATVVDGLPAGLEGLEARRAARAAIDHAVAAWCAARDGDTAATALQAAGVAAGVVQDAGDLADRDPQLAARGFWLDAELPEFGPRRHDRFPARFERTPLDPYRPPPSYLGEGNFEVLTELAGLSFDEVAEGIADGLFT